MGTARIPECLVKNHKPMNQRPLTIRQTLQWADAYRETAGKWPTQTSGAVAGVMGENWALPGCRPALWAWRANRQILPGSAPG